MTNTTKSLKITHPEIAADWDSDKNSPQLVDDVCSKSKNPVWWTCMAEHSYQVSPYTRVRTAGCKYCNKSSLWAKIAQNRINQGKYKSFAKVAPAELLSQWDMDLNSVKPKSVSAHSHQKIHWRCPAGHTWIASPNSRLRGRGCPECVAAGASERIRAAKLKIGGISLAAAFPDLMVEWDNAKNKFDPSRISPKSKIKAHWKCRFGHDWQAVICNRTLNKSNCPNCTSQTSRLEIYLLCELRSVYQSVEWRKKIEGVEADIYLTDHSIAIEIDGEYWHRKKQEQDLRKTEFFKSLGIRTVRVRSDQLGDVRGITVPFAKKETEQQVCMALMDELQTLAPDYDLENYLRTGIQRSESDFKEMIARLPAPPEEESLARKCPAVAAQWDFEVNSPLTPDLFSPNSDQNFWWICKNQHRWQATIKNRTMRGSGCPICHQESKSLETHKRHATANGNLAERHPLLAELWDKVFNGTLTPQSISIRSTRTCNWHCPVGHSFQRSPKQLIKDSGCPICLSFEHQCPDLLKEWDYEKNVRIQPSDCQVSSGKKVWWTCFKRHSWEQRVADRTGKSKSGCPVCWAIRRGVNEDLAIARHENKTLLEFKSELIFCWASSKNDPDVLPEKLSVRDKTLRWWTCFRHHFFEQSVFRMASGYRCPDCARIEAVEKTRLAKLRKIGSFAIRFPELVALWHPSANCELTPVDLGIGSHRMVWWRCENGHEFQQTPNYLVTLFKRGSSSLCSLCSSKDEGRD